MSVKNMMPVAWWKNYLEDRIQRIQLSMNVKAAEYAETTEDRMHNFNRSKDASAGRYPTREAAMFGMLLKHWTSILDLLDKNDVGTATPLPVLQEKFGDMINYMILMEGSLIHSQHPNTFEDLPF
jgi:hypothetical protein